MIQIFTDTSANLPASYIQKYALRVIPLTYLIDGVEAHQDPTVDFDGKAYYDAMRSGTPVTTAMINLAGFLEPSARSWWKASSPTAIWRCARCSRPATM